MKVVIQAKVKNKLKHCYEEGLPNETGGVLFGYYSDDLKTAIVTDTFIDRKGSKGTLKNFIRGENGFKEYSKKMWKKNKFYLGEWHTHPNSSPLMSQQDKAQMIQIRKNKKINCPEPILLIVGKINKKIKVQTYIFGESEIKKFEMINV